MNDRSHLSRREQVLAAVSSFSCLAFLITVVLLCLLACVVGILLLNEVEEFEPITLVEERMPVDSFKLPENLEVRDWNALAMNMLHENGWKFPINLVLFSAHVPCASLSDASNVRMEFVAKDGSLLLPHKMVGVVSFDRQKGDATVWIYDAGPKLAHAPIMHSASLKVELREALDGAERLGGKEFRTKLTNKCDIGIWLHDYKWNIDYRDPLSTQSGLRIKVDAVSGRVTSSDR